MMFCRFNQDSVALGLLTHEKKLKNDIMKTEERKNEKTNRERTYRQIQKLNEMKYLLRSLYRSCVRLTPGFYGPQLQYNYLC
jgi:hypothetical protein